MAKKKERICKSCGNTEETFSNVLYCAACYIKNKKLVFIEKEIQQMIDWGYEVLAEPTYNEHGKRVYQIKNIKCDHEFSTTFGNLKTGVFKNKDFKPCGVCGKTRRTEKLIALSKLGMPPKARSKISTHNATSSKNAVERRKSKEYEDMVNYRDLVRLLSNTEFRKSYHQINPSGHKRGKDFHLDHIIPIDYCFKNQIPAERCASLENLRLISDVDNMKKGADLDDAGKMLLEKWLG